MSLAPTVLTSNVVTRNQTHNTIFAISTTNQTRVDVMRTEKKGTPYVDATLHMHTYCIHIHIERRRGGRERICQWSQAELDSVGVPTLSELQLLGKFSCTNPSLHLLHSPHVAVAVATQIEKVSGRISAIRPVRLENVKSLRVGCGASGKIPNSNSFQSFSNKARFVHVPFNPYQL